MAPSDQKLQFVCGGQQWVHEVCFPAGTYERPNHSTEFVEELLKEIEASGSIAAPTPIEQRWSTASRCNHGLGTRSHELSDLVAQHGASDLRVVTGR